MTCLDEITIGDFCNIANNVVIVDHNHKFVNTGVIEGYESSPIHIGNRVWIGANVVVMPGVTIGNNSVIGAGSVVTKDIPANVVAFGNPCKVHREITEQDEVYYNRNCKIDIDI